MQQCFMLAVLHSAQVGLAMKAEPGGYMLLHLLHVAGLIHMLCSSLSELI